eukprot:CAMPEP_0201982232 /NCGR_PEP_ID=MMETSP0904-20121228/76167_1 /ASSEMBLY_ACC=CAM_ASM_000553 /TAXON_ID=420261 /ORGANISM="Thalassiosira antarctica, Strain CCMP982" /LENGTH=47 /DNA_ID= /DNA_START= /DNA_END= /DNA_ORIENTATION=
MTNPAETTCNPVVCFGNIIYDSITVTTFLSVATATATAGPLRRINSI